MSIDQHISVTATINNAGIALEGFGLIGTMTYASLFSERRKVYSSLAAVIADGYAADSPEAKSVGSILAQSPHPRQVALLRGIRPPTLKFELDAIEVRDSSAYAVNVSGEGVVVTEVEYVSDAAATQAEIHAGLLEALNDVEDKNYTVTFSPLVLADKTFVGEDDDDTLTSATALVNPDDTFTADASDVCTAVAHGLLTGDGPFQLTTTLADLPLNLLTATDYWIIRIDADTFYLAESVADAIAGVFIDIGDAGTGVHTIVDTAETRRLVLHTLQTGDGPFQVSNAGGALPTGLVAATDYWAIVTGVYTFKLASTLALALAGTALPLTTDGTGIQTLADTVNTVRPADPIIATGTAAGDYFVLEIVDTTALSIQSTTTDPGIATDLAEIATANKDWYYLVLQQGASKTMLLSAAAWTEAQPFKFFVAESSDTACENDAVGGTDVADDLAEFEYKRTHFSYRRDASTYFSAGLASQLAALPVGSWTAAYKTVIGSTAETFEEQQTDNLDGKRATYYKSEGGKSISWQGMVGNTDYGFWDITVALDFVVDLIQKRAFGIFVARPKVAYTDEDIELLTGAIEGAVDIAKSKKHKIVAPGTPGNFDTDPQPTVSFPRVKDIDPSARSLRNLPDGVVSFRLQGAVHTVDVDLTVSF